MKTDKEINKLIALNVMGWIEDDGTRWSTMDENFGTDKAVFKKGFIAPKDQIYPHESVYKLLPPDYSGSLEQAWKIVERICQEKNMHHLLTTSTDVGNYSQFENRVYKGEPDTFGSGWQKTPTEAICWAALSIYGIK